MEDNEKVVVETKSDQRLFTMVYHDFLTSELLNYYEKMIFIMLKKHADSKTHEAYPSLATISKETGISKRKVQNCLNHMEELKVIKRKRRKPIMAIIPVIYIHCMIMLNYGKMEFCQKNQNQMINNDCLSRSNKNM